MSEVLPSVAALVEKVEGRKALYFFAAGVVFIVFVNIVLKNRDEKNV